LLAADSAASASPRCSRKSGSAEPKKIGVKKGGD